MNSTKLAACFLLSTLYFLCPISSSADINVYFSPNGGCAQAVIEQAKASQQSIDIAMYSFSSRIIAQALDAAKEREVKVMRSNSIPATA